MVQFISLSSGSNGNCYYIGNGEKGILIDVGIGTRTVKKRLALHGIDVNSVQMVLVSHDHFDHIKSVGTFAQKYNKPVFSTRKILNALEKNFCTSGKLTGLKNVIKEGMENNVAGLKVTPFEVPHDATQTIGYHIDFDGVKITIMTDIGAVTDDAVKYGKEADYLIAESNYDMDMLMRGEYTKELKERIISGHGHLSNEENSHLLRLVNHEGLKAVYLCHLSGNNNSPELAYMQAKKTLESIGSGASLHCLPRSAASQIFTWQMPRCVSRG